MSTKSSTSSSIPSEEKTSANISQSHRRSQMTRIWEWGVDETLWNPDKVTSLLSLQVTNLRRPGTQVVSLFPEHLKGCLNG
jgi:hypothetical protein